MSAEAERATSTAVTNRTSGPVAMAMLVVVISFSASLVISQARLRHIEERTAAIFHDALPSLEHVSSLRTELRRLGMYVNEYVLGGDARATPSRQELSEVRRKIADEVRLFGARPSSAEEAADFQAIVWRLEQLDASVEETLQAADSKALPAFLHPLLAIFHGHLEQVDEGILHLRQLQLNKVRVDSERILHARQASLTLALILGGGSALLALFASALVLQTLRSRARLKEANDRLQLQHANRLATVGQLTAGIAHELGSPLQVVLGRASQIARGDVKEAGARDAASIIVNQSHRMKLIVRGLLDYARRRPPKREVTNLLELAGETMEMLTPIARKRAIALELDATGPLLAEVDTLHVQQALTNLVMNALQAVDVGGHVRITARLEQATPPHDAGGHPGLFATLGVRDDGPGINEKDKPHVFDPFFTTKGVGEGSGLGLVVADDLVRENGGWISVESQFGHGACFSIFLPPHAQDTR